MLYNTRQYLKKGESIDVFWFTNSIEPPISQVMSEIPIRGHPSFIRSCSCFVLNNRGNLLSQYMQLTGRKWGYKYNTVKTLHSSKYLLFVNYVFQSSYYWTSIIDDHKIPWSTKHLKKNKSMLTKEKQNTHTCH